VVDFDIDDTHITLEWDRPQYAFSGYWLSHTLQATPDYAWGSTATGSYHATVAARFTSAQLNAMGVIGETLTHVSFWAGHGSNVARNQFTVHVWVGGRWDEAQGGVRDPGDAIVEQDLPLGSVQARGWHNALLDTPVVIPADGELWIGVTADGAGIIPNQAVFGMTNPTLDFSDNHFGNLTINHGEATPAWANVVINYATPPVPHTFNFMLRGLVYGLGGDLASISHTYFTPSSDSDFIINGPEFGAICKSTEPPSSRSSRNFLGYHVIRDGNTITPEVITAERFVDLSPVVGRNQYRVVAVYEGLDDASTPSNVADITIRQRPRVVVTKENPWLENFDDSGVLSNWFTIRNIEPSQSNFMRLGTFSYQHAIGRGSLSSISTATGGVLNNPDNWAITPRLELPVVTEEGQGLVFRYVVTTNNLGPLQGQREHYSILVTTEDSAKTEAFDEVLYSVTLGAQGNREWLYKELCLTEFAGQTILLAIRHHNMTEPMSSIVFDNFWVGVDAVSDFEPDPTVRVSTTLRGNFPNPFNPETSIAFTMAYEGHVNIEVFNIRGQRVATVLNENRPAGNNTVVWKGTDDEGRQVGSGIYFYRMTTGDFTSTRRMVLMK
jgi:hypothetical protein